MFFSEYSYPECSNSIVSIFGEKVNKNSSIFIYFMYAIIAYYHFRYYAYNMPLVFSGGMIQMRKKRNLKKLLNLNILDYTNLTTKFGDLDMPYVSCNYLPKIDYIANYSQPSTYFKTMNTYLGFMEYDLVFDGLYGLWNAIYYGVKELQDFYIERFKGVKFFIAPDYSKCGDASEVENCHRQFRSRIVSIWLTVHLGAIVIPLVTCANREEMKYMLDGMHDCKTVAFNAKGPMGDKEQLPIFCDAIKYTVDNLPNLESIVVYSTSPNIDKVNHIFKYAIDAGIKLIVPDNMLQTRHRILGGGE